MNRTTRIAVVVGVALGMFALGGAGVLRLTSSEPAAPPASAATRSSDALLKPASASGSLTQAIGALQVRLRALPHDWQGFANLGLAYVAQARTTADPSYYPKAQGVLQRSLQLEQGDNFQAMVGMGALALARHDFAGALLWGHRAEAANPYNGNVYGVVGDAQVELGRDQDALATFQKMVNTEPDVSSYARVSYARELLGDIPGAISAMQAARGAAGDPSNAAWAANQLGELYFNSGRVAEAERQYRSATQIDPTFIPPHAGLAKVAWARGDSATAIQTYTWVTQRYPLPEYVIALGDLYAVSGQTDLVLRQYQLVHAEEQIFKANGVNIDLELALFDASHGDPAGALAAARAEWDRRHSIHVADALGWALFENHRYAEAATYARQALKLGTKNALFMFHAGMIQLKLGNRDEARRLLSEAVATNPNFSILYSPVAERTLRMLGGKP